MAEDNESFVSSAPMLFGEEFAKQATTTVDQVKAMKKLSFSEKKSFSGYHPRSYQTAVAGVEPRATVQNTSRIRGEGTRQASHPTAKDKAVKNKGTRFVTKYCKLFKRNYNLSPYFKFKHGSALSKEGDQNQFTCRPYKGVQRELGPADSGSLGTTDSSGFPTTPCKSTS